MGMSHLKVTFQLTTVTVLCDVAVIFWSPDVVLTANGQILGLCTLLHLAGDMEPRIL